MTIWQTLDGRASFHITMPRLKLFQGSMLTTLYRTAYSAAKIPLTAGDLSAILRVPAATFELPDFRPCE